jgi:hypothetical protein
MDSNNSEYNPPQLQSSASKELPTNYPIEIGKQTHRHHNWPMLAALMVGALAFAVLVVIGGRWVYHTTKHAKPAASNTQDLPAPPPTNL